MSEASDTPLTEGQIAAWKTMLCAERPPEEHEQANALCDMAISAARLRAELSEANAENEVLREQNFEMNKTIAANRSEIERLREIDSARVRDYNALLLDGARAEKELAEAQREVERLKGNNTFP